MILRPHSNQIRVDTSPARYAMYSGDVNQDGSVNLTDVTIIHNSATLFSSGYVPSDLNNDGLVNLTDILMAYNNSTKFVSTKRP